MIEATVYQVTHLASGNRYVGVTTRSTRRRLRDHLDSARARQKTGRRTTPFHDDLLRDGIDGFQTETIAVLSQREAFELERSMVARLREEGRCYNIRHGGQRAPMAESSKDMLRGRVVSDDTRRKLSEALSGRVANERQRSALNAGRRMPKNLKGERNPRAKLTFDQVKEIRAATGSQQSIADRYGVTQMLVSKIKARLRWPKEEY